MLKQLLSRERRRSAFGFDSNWGLSVMGRPRNLIPGIDPAMTNNRKLGR